MTMQQRPPTFEEFLAELEEERRRRQGLPPLARQPPPSPDELIQPGQFRPGEAAGMVSPVQAAQRLAAGVPAMIGGAFLPEYYKPFAAAAAETAQRLIPGQQDIERRVAAKIAMGMRPWEAAEETEKEGLGLPSTQVPLLSLLPGMGVNAPGPRLQLGLQGFLEAIAPVPFAGPVARAAGAVAAPAVKAAAPVIRRGVTEAVAAARPVVAEAARAGERYVGRAIETGGVSAGIPAPARVTAARAAKEPEFLTLKGVDAELRRMDTAIKSGERIKADTTSMSEARDSLAEYRRNLLQSELTESQWDDLLQAEERLNELTAELDVFTSGPETGVMRPPASAKGGIGLWPTARLRMLAQHEGLNPAQPDWWDSIDSVVVKELRGAHVPKAQTKAGLQREIASLKAEIRHLESGAPALAKPTAPRPIVTGPGGQVGMGIGERAPQGQLLPEYVGAGERIPLAAPEQLAARQARAAEVARGQAEMPVNADGTVTLFHGTSPTGAAAIRRSGTLVGKEDGVFLTTDREAARSFGGEVVEVRVNPKRLQLDDEFPSGRRDFRIPARIGEPVPVGLEPTAAELPGQAVKPVAAAAKPVAEPAPGLPILGIKGATEPVTPGAAAGVPPTEPPGPPVAPSGAAGAPKGPMPAVTSALSQAKAIVDRDAPGLVTRVLDYVPGPKQVQRGLHPSLGMSRKVLEPYVAEGNVLGTTSTQLSEVRVPVVNRLKETFGEGVVRGTEKAEIRFLGTPAQAKYPATKTLYDIAQNPHLYDLSPVQRSAIEEGDAALGRVFEQVRADYGLEIGKFPNRPGSMFLSNIEKPEAGKGIFEATVRTSTSSRAKTRFYETGRERWEHDVARGIEKPYDPVVDVEHLIGGEMHGGLSRMAGRTVYKEGLGGLNRMEALTATGHEGLVNKMVGLRKRLQTLQGELRTLNQEASQAIDDFMASPLEDTDMTALREALDIQVAPGRYVAKASPDVGKGIKLLQEEIKGVRLQIKGLQPAWKSANAKGYQFVQEGVYRYFPDADAQQIRRLAEVSNNPLLRWVDDLRATAFGGDLSPVSIQMLTAWLSDPVGVSQALAKRGVRGGMFTEQSMLVSLKADPAGWNRFTSGTGLNPLGGVDKEFSVGLIGKIPGVGKFWTDFNETVYRPVMRLTKDIFDNSYAAGIKHGLTEEQAIAVAADDATKIIPRFNPRRLGMSQAESARYRAVLTSVSFLTQPTALTIDATKAFLKMGLKQPITQSERFAVQRVSKIIAVTEALAVSTAVGYAIKEGQDPKQAALDALNSTHPNFMAITMPWGAKVGLGGPFRSLIRAVVPREVPGIPVPVPFAGIYRFGMSKMGPGLRAAYEVAPGVNRDYRGRTIRKHDSVPLDILRSIEHVVSGVAPLTTGTAYRTLRQGEGIGAAGEEALSQFAGTNYIPFDAIYAAKLRWDKDLDAYRDIPGDDRKAEAEGKPTRDAYLRANPEVDAKVFIIGERGSLQTFTARLAAARLMRENNLKVADIKGLEVQENEKFTDERVVLRRWLEANLERGQMQGQGQVEPTPVGAERGAGLMEWLGPEPVEAR